MTTSTSSNKQKSASIKNLNRVIVAPLKPSRLSEPLYTASFFSGIRGFDIGATKAGFQSVLLSDYWYWAGQAFRQNFPKPEDATHPEHLHSEGVYVCGNRLGDINNISFNAIRNYVREGVDIDLKAGRLDVIHGGPPCQDFSKCNNYRSEHSAKNLLIFQLLRIINEAKPKVGLIEQVPDLLCHKFRRIWRRVRLVLNSMTDYYWDFQVMNAKNYGARQDRKRVIIMLVRKDLSVLPSFPKPTQPDLSKVAVNVLLPEVFHFSPGHFKDGIKDATKNVFCTMTATGSEKFYGFDGISYSPRIDQRLVLTELEGLKLTGIPETHCKTLVGNMVQISFAEALFKHIREHILRR
jgi:site-specific DNA-cytosine methylase